MIKKNDSSFFKTYDYVSKDKRLNRRQKSLFSILDGFLQHSEKILYSNSTLSEKNDCHPRNVTADIAVLKKLKYIRTEGESFQRRFFRGELYFGQLVDNPDAPACLVQELHTVDHMIDNPRSLVQELHTVDHMIYNPRSYDLEHSIKRSITLDHMIYHYRNINTDIDNRKQQQTEPAPQSVVVVVKISKEIDQLLLTAYRTNPVKNNKIKTEHDFLAYCVWAIDIDRPSSQMARAKQWVKWIDAGSFEILPQWNPGIKRTDFVVYTNEDKISAEQCEKNKVRLADIMKGLKK